MTSHASRPRFSKRAALSLIGLSVALAALAPAAARAQAAWPSKPITFIVPYAAGSSIDVFTRVMGQELSKRLSTPVVVENVNGAGGAIATAKLAHANPDGYTFGMGVESTVLLAQLTRPKTVRYDGLKDLAPIAKIAWGALVVVGKPALPAKNAEELLALLRADSKGLGYGTTGIGTSLHVAGEIISQEGKVPLLHVPYSVSTQIMNDISGNQLDLAIMPVGAVMPFIKSGKAKAYAVTSAKRFPTLPDTPALAELPGLGKVDAAMWWGMFAPAGVPAAISARMSQEVLAVLENPRLRAQALEFGVQLAPAGPDAFGAQLREEMAHYAAIVKEHKLQAE